MNDSTIPVFFKYRFASVEEWRQLYATSQFNNPRGTYKKKNNVHTIYTHLHLPPAWRFEFRTLRVWDEDDETNILKLNIISISLLYIGKFKPQFAFNSHVLMIKFNLVLYAMLVFCVCVLCTSYISPLPCRHIFVSKLYRKLNFLFSFLF